MMVYDPKADHYVRLGVAAEATAAEIRTAYRARIKRAHPDKATGSTAAAAALNVAYDVLGDPGKRAAYDDARRGHLAAVAAAKTARAAAAAAKAARATARAKKGRARGAPPAAAAKGPRKVRARPRPAPAARAAPAAPAASPVAWPASSAAPPPSAVEKVVENVVQSIRTEQYGRAFGWFLVGLFTPPPASSNRPPVSQQGQRRRRG
jgi:curved DNA-binding protein CbpA